MKLKSLIKEEVDKQELKDALADSIDAANSKIVFESVIFRR